MNSPAAPEAQDARSSKRHEINVKVVVSREGDHYSALIPDYTIAGRGDSQEAAIVNAAELVVTYLRPFAEKDRIAEARRPIPLRWRLELEAQLLLSRLHLGGSHSVARRTQHVPLPC